MTDSPTPPAHPRAETDHRARPADQPPSVDAAETPQPPADEAARQAQDTVRSISRLEESN